MSKNNIAMTPKELAKLCHELTARLDEVEEHTKPESKLWKSLFQKVDQTLPAYLPSVFEAIDELKHFKLNVGAKIDEKESNVGEQAMADIRR